MKNNSVKKILLTGASGYIGRHILEMLLGVSNYSVSILVRPTSDLKHISHCNNQVEIYEYTGFESLNNIFKVEDFDLVIHLAGYVGSGTSYEVVDRNIKGNLVLATQLLEAMRLNDVNKIINTGSYWEFGDQQEFVPKTIYAIYKTTVRNLVSEYIESYKFSGVNLILYDVYGDEDGRKKIIPTLLSLKENETISMTPGFQKLNFVHIKDVIKGYKKSINALIEEDQDFANGTFHLRSNEFISLRKLVNKFQSISGKKINVNWGSKSYSKFQIMQPNLRGSTLPEWDASITIDDGLSKIICREF